MNEQEIDLIELFKKMIKHLPLLILLSVIVGASSFAASKFLITPKYEANASMLISNSKINNNEINNIEYSQISANKALISTYSEIVKSKGIADRVIANLGLDMDYEEFSNKVSIVAIKDTQIINVRVVDTIPERAQDIANETANIFKSSIGDIMNADNVQILDGATLPEEPSSPKIFRNTIAGLMLGFIIGLLIVTIKELSDTKIKSSEDITTEFDIPVLGLIPDRKKFK